MRFPFVTVTRLDLELDALRATLVSEQERADKAEAQAAYWRARAERLVDNALARAGAVAEPVFVERKPVLDPMQMAVAALSQREIDSSKVRSS